MIGGIVVVVYCLLFIVSAPINLHLKSRKKKKKKIELSFKPSSPTYNPSPHSYFQLQH